MSNTKVESNNINMLNALRTRMSISYQDRIPEATENNITNIYNDLTNPYDATARNELIPALVNLIVAQSVNTGIFRNKLRGLKSERMDFGNAEQEIFLNMANPYVYDPKAGVDVMYGIYESYVMAAYHKINFSQQYRVTIWYDDLRKAFLNNFGLRNLITAKVETLLSGYNWDEFLCMKQLLDSAYDSSVLYPVTVEAVTTDDSAKALLTKVKEYIGKASFPNTSLNIAGSTAQSEPSDLLFITTPGVNANISVQALAYAYNMDKADVEVNTIIIDEFENPGIQAVLCDRRFFKVRDHFATMSDDRSGAGLRWNHYYTVQEMISYSPFYDAIVFTTDASGLTSLTITAPAANITPGNIVDLTVTAASASNDVYKPLIVDWDVTSPSGKSFVIPGTNKLQIDSTEAKTSKITVKATSRYAPDVTGNVELTVV